MKKQEKLPFAEANIKLIELDVNSVITTSSTGADSWDVIYDFGDDGIIKGN